MLLAICLSEREAYSDLKQNVLQSVMCELSIGSEARLFARQANINRYHDGSNNVLVG